MEEDYRVVMFEDPDSFKKLELLQTEIWGRNETVPYHMLIAFQRMGGVVLVAVDRLDRPVGMLYGFIAMKNGEIFHYLHLCGVAPDKRAQGIATALFMRLREYLLENGVEVARWLLDPLQIPEARLSIHRLGAIGKRYDENFYGSMRDPYNRGLDSDRLEIEWRLNSRRVLNRISEATELDVEQLLNEGARKMISTIKEGLIYKILNYKLDLRADKILVEVPSDIGFMKKVSISAAVEWREVTRKIFKKYLSNGYLVTDLIKEGEPHPRYYYLLEKGVSED